MHNRNLEVSINLVCFVCTAYIFEKIFSKDRANLRVEKEHIDLFIYQSKKYSQKLPLLKELAANAWVKLSWNLGLKSKYTFLKS